ncbi:MAG: translation initiation factor IF-3 [Candidatus Ancillula sp.]|nr:translation initiation factor IF-3 [Candidatus Ancillula sp.]
MNDAITSSQVRLIDEKGGQVGIVSTKDALSRASAVSLDLVLMAPDANPPVAKILDYSKHRYELDMKKRESRRNQGGAGLKEVRFRLKIDHNDFAIKITQVAKFLKSGDKVKVQIQFKGREQQHPEMGVDMLHKVALEVKEHSTILNKPTLDGRNITMVLQPTAKKEYTISEQRRRGRDVVNARAERQAKRLAAKGLDASGKKVTKKEEKNAKK